MKTYNSCANGWSYRGDKQGADGVSVCTAAEVDLQGEKDQAKGELQIKCNMGIVLSPNCARLPHLA
jgi:hypothetical protein